MIRKNLTIQFEASIFFTLQYVQTNRLVQRMVKFYQFKASKSSAQDLPKCSKMENVKISTFRLRIWLKNAQVRLLSVSSDSQSIFLVLSKSNTVAERSQSYIQKIDTFGIICVHKMGVTQNPTVQFKRSIFFYYSMYRKVIWCKE